MSGGRGRAEAGVGTDFVEDEGRDGTGTENGARHAAWSVCSGMLSAVVLGGAVAVALAVPVVVKVLTPVEAPVELDEEAGFESTEGSPNCCIHCSTWMSLLLRECRSTFSAAAGE